ncbi:MAG: hypothetical protein AAB787_01670 [Patescibacteria group bacterium]
MPKETMSDEEFNKFFEVGKKNDEMGGVRSPNCEYCEREWWKNKGNLIYKCEKCNISYGAKKWCRMIKREGVFLEVEGEKKFDYVFVHEKL